MTTVVTAPLTPKSDPLPHVVKLKVSWKTTRKWTNADVVDYRRSVPMLAERIRTEQYWSKGGVFIRTGSPAKISRCEYLSSMRH
jgi:hypothetical protein